MCFFDLFCAKNNQMIDLDLKGHLIDVSFDHSRISLLCFNLISKYHAGAERSMNRCFVLIHKIYFKW